MIVVEWLGGTCHPFPSYLAFNQGVGLQTVPVHTGKAFLRIKFKGLKNPYQGVTGLLTVKDAEVVEIRRSYNLQGRPLTPVLSTDYEENSSCQMRESVSSLSRSCDFVPGSTTLFRSLLLLIILNQSALDTVPSWLTS